MDLKAKLNEPFAALIVIRFNKQELSKKRSYD